MVQGLAFLSKKSWHVKNIANQERVWVEEQKKAAEELKTKELAKQIQQELEQEELDRIAGRKKSDRLDRGIDWMYQGVKSEACKEDAEKEAEDYLLGKKFTGGVTEHKGDLVQDQSEEKEGMNAVISTVEEKSAPSASMPFDGPSVKDKNEAFRVRHEDPMFLVTQKRREEENKIEKKKALYERVVGPVDCNHESDDKNEKRRKQKKEEKRKKKEQRREERRRRRQRRHSSPSDSDQSDYNSGSEYKKHRSHGKRRRTSSPRRNFNEDHHTSRYNDRYYSSDDDGYHRRPKIDRRDSKRHNYRDHSRDARLQPVEVGEISKKGSHREFGLQGSKKKPISTNNLGPNRKLLEEKRKKVEAKRRLHESSSRKRMTAEERELALQEMQSNASRQAVSRSVVPQASKKDERKSAMFLHKIAQETHGIRNDNASMASRVTQNRDRIQKSIDDSFY
mmetsp:Transcript_1704/g.2319  ORF Transcript_1704/g.2319 Transcript_1704/m.2319 type:complete len:450 (+) Transcript_1704:349-1698(+)